MEFHIGAPIFDRDGDKVGQLKHVIVDPDTREIVEVVLGESGLLGREVLVPIEAVREAMHDRIQLELDKDQIKSLKDFVITRYVTSPSGILMDTLWAGGALYPQPIPPVGAATGIETIAATPLVEEIPQVPERDIDIRSGMEVWATDGKVGTVEDVIYDDQTNRVRGFIIRRGLLFHHDVEVPISWVARIHEDRITLNVNKQQLATHQTDHH